jgi:subfamily B ATP-binding cassette protein MsbA
MNRCRALFKFLRPLVWRLAAALAATAVLTVLGLVPPLLLKSVIDDVIEQSNVGLLPIIAAIAVGVAVFTPIVEFYSSVIIKYLGRRFVFDVRNTLYEKILSHSMGFFHQMSAGRLMSRLMEDTAAVQRMITANSVTLVNDTVSFFFCMAALIYLRWELGLVVIGLVPLYVFNHHFFVKRIAKKNREMLSYRELVVAQIEERISGTRLVKMYSREKAESEHLRDQLDEIVRLASAGTLLNSMFTGMATSITSLGNALLFGLGCFLVMHEWMTYGEVMAFMAYLSRMLLSALNFTQITGQLQETMVSVDRVTEILEMPLELQEKPGAKVLPPVTGNIRFENVEFGYIESQPVLSNFNLEIPAGKVVALVGHSGCGKSTLTSLLLRFYDPQKGRILIDGNDVSDVTLRSLRKQMSQVLQQPFLFDDTIRANIRYGKPEATDAEVRKVAEIANLTEWIESLPDQYDTVLGERGLRPSLGQKQQLSIARAIMTDPAVLIMDEATSSLDAASEAMIQGALERVLRGRTSLVVAHRLSTIRNADLIVVMDHGRVVETGAHDDLMEKEGGRYRAFYTRQSEGVAIDADDLGESEQSAGASSAELRAIQ